MDILLISIEVLIILVSIVFVCVIFTNAVEHLGCKLNLSQGAVGSVLAAVGTALPETLIPLVAIIGAYLAKGNVEAGQAIGIGAILGAPFLLGTLAFCITGIAVYIYAGKGKRTREMPVNVSVMKRDLQYFMIVYLMAVLCSFIQNYYIKAAVAIFLIILYARYVYATVNDNSVSSGIECEIETLFLSRWFKDNLATTLAQVFLSIGAIIVLAHLFVGRIEQISEIFNISPLILSLIIAPIATELPEKFNSVIWIRANKDTLAMGNITGAMVFQSSIPTAVGILLTPWVLDDAGLISVLLVYASIILVYINLFVTRGILKPWILCISGIFYFLYLFYILRLL